MIDEIEDNSGLGDKPVDSTQIVCSAAKGENKTVSFRTHDSFILNKSILAKSIAETSMDLGTLLEKEKDDGVPNPSEMTNFNTMDSMEKSVGDLDFNYDESAVSIPPQCNIQPTKNDTTRLRLPGCLTSDVENPTLGAEIVATNLNEEIKETACDPDAVCDGQSLQRHELQSEWIEGLIRSHKEKNNQRSQPDEFADTNITPFNGHDGNGHQTTSNIPSADAKPSESTNATKEGYCTRNRSLQHTIPKIASATVMKEKVEDRVGLVFTDKNQRITLAKMMPNSPFRHTCLGINDELLMVNGHRIKNARKAAEIIKRSTGTLTITAFKGKRPRESALEMIRLSEPDCKDIHCFTNNSMVHIIKASGRFSRSGRIKAGDIILSINGNPVVTAERVTELLRKGSQEDHRQLSKQKSDYDLDPDPPLLGGLAIMVVLSLAKLRCRLIKKLSNNLPVTWNRAFNECSITLPSGSAQRMLAIHNDGNCEDISDAPEGSDPKILKDIDTFASTFYSQFQDSIRDLREAMQHAIRDCDEMDLRC